jgi:hypothetical protein
LTAAAGGTAPARRGVTVASSALQHLVADAELPNGDCVRVILEKISAVYGKYGKWVVQNKLRTLMPCMMRTN